MSSLDHSERYSPEGDNAGNGWLIGGGEMGELIRSMDWSQTPLGPLEAWPNSLRTTVSLCLASNFPINIIWGPGYNQIYNAGYRVVVGERHPAGMGMAYDVCWASAWPAIGEPFQRAWVGETSFLENQRMFLTRNGYLEETFFTFSLSPIRNENGVISGLFHPVTETTVSMLSERRTRALRELAENTRDARTLEAAFEATARSCASHELDVPFVLLYSLDGQMKSARLVAHSGIQPGLPVSPESVALGSAEDRWGLRAILNAGGMVKLEKLRQRFGEFPCGPYPEGSECGVARALTIPGLESPLGVIILGASPRLPFSDAYRGHLDQLTAAAGTALGNALAYEQERKRAEALAAIDHAKTQFFANVSHEFRTPLSLMLGPVEAVLATGPEELSEDNREQIRIARRNSLRLLKLVNTLLDFSRIEAGRAQATFEPVSLAELTAELAGNFRSAIESAGMQLVVDCPHIEERVHVDPEMWEKIVLNLLSNAFKFTLQGRIEIRLKSDGKVVRLEVHDTGLGIPAGQLAHVFERFHRIEGQAGRTHEGTGIGLALVDEFARLHGGSVAVTSEVDVGSTFTVTIPLGRSHLDPARVISEEKPRASRVRAQAYTEEASRWNNEAPAALALGRETNQVLGKGERRPSILLAEDNADMRDYILHVLGAAYEVRTVGNGQEALEAIAADVPDLVLSDVMMPRMSGTEMIQAIRANPEIETLPVILLSARAGEEAKAEGIELGADDYLVKPFSPRELKARVRTHLQLTNLREEATAHREALRTAELLRQSEKLAVVGRLASSIAHEINNPLEAVTNLLYLAAGSDDSQEASGYIRSAQEQLTRITHITTQTLRFHRQSTRPELAAMPELLDSVVSLYAARLMNAGVTIRRDYRAEARINCFAGDLRQVFANLVGNALDATPTGGTITLRVREASEPARGTAGVRVTVADSGHGMPKHVRDRIFDPFFTTKEDTGTGLGLWVSSEILRNHASTVSVRSSQIGGRSGTVFSVFLPHSVVARSAPDPAGDLEATP